MERCRKQSTIRQFIDEGNAFIYTTEFARAVQQSNNYYVIVTREGLVNLPYSVEEIYGIRESGKYASIKRTYNAFYHIYDKKNMLEHIVPTKIIKHCIVFAGII